jgi:hypothetical protein
MVHCTPSAAPAITLITVVRACWAAVFDCGLLEFVRAFLGIGRFGLIGAQTSSEAVFRVDLAFWVWASASTEVVAPGAPLWTECASGPPIG